MSEIVQSICPYDCPSTCGLLMEVEDGKIVRVRNNPDHPVSRNGICRKTLYYERSIYSDRRILTPLLRTGKKGEGRFEPISWEEAVGMITDRWKTIIRESGPEAILPWVYSGVMSEIQRHCGDAFFNRMGASDLVRTLCCPAKSDGYQAVAGNTGCLDPHELNDSDYYLIWGCNMAATRLQSLVDINRKKDRKKILIDTYANPTGKYCDETLSIRAGTDGALALAMMHVLDAEGLSDEDFLRKYTAGYEDFRATLGRYTPDWAQEITGIPAKTIERLAREYASAKAPAIILGSGNTRYGNGGMTVRLITILSMFTGAWTRPGGGLCGCSPVRSPYVDASLIRRPDFRKKPVRSFNINQTGSALIKTGQDAIRSLYVFGGNPANTVGNQEAVIEGLKREDLFTVVHDRFMTETALYADIVLPATFSVEQYDIYKSYGYCTLGTAKPVIRPLGQAKSNWDTFCLLARAMGYEEEYFTRSEEEMLNYILDHPTPDVAALPEDKQKILREGGSIAMPYADHMDIAVPGGRFLIVNEDLEDPVPCYRPAYGGDYPLKLVAAPSLYSLNSEYRDRSDLMEARGPQTLIMNRDDALEREIEDGQTVEAYNDQAAVLFRVLVRDHVARGNVICEGIYRRDHCKGGKAFNCLTSERLSDMGEGTTMNDNTVEVRTYAEG